MSDKHHLQVNGPADVPAFTCLVYLTKTATGFDASVANLDGITASGETEREVLGKIVPAFRQRVRQAVQGGHDIPWIDPPPPMAADQLKRIVPVHL